MKPLYSYALIAAFAAIGQASAAVEATTTPVGYVSLGDATAGQPAVKANTDSYIAIPLLRPAEFAGTVSLVGQNEGKDVIGITGAAFTPNQFTSTVPYVAVIEDGTLSGMVLLITENAADFITVSAQGGDSVAALPEGSKISIRKAWTLKTLFTGNTLPSGTQLATYGSKTGVNTSADAIYEYNGTIWENSDDFELSDNVVIYPGEGFRLRSPSGAPIVTLTVPGEVGKANYRNVLQKYSASLGQDNFISYFTPTGEIIGSSGLGLTAGDQLIEWSNSVAGINKPAQKIYEFNGTIWEDSDDFTDVTNTLVLQGGKAYRYRRAASAPAGPQVVSDIPAYVPTL